MNVSLSPIAAAERPTLEALFELYAYDFSEMLGLDVAPDGRFHPPPLDAYFTGDRAHPFFIRVDASLAGFALIQERSRLTGALDVRDVGEFFVLRRFRRQGVGERAAIAVFDRFPGKWEVRERAENVAGTAFWRRAIDRYTGGRFDDFVSDDSRWRGPVQRFETPRREA